jgi:hypothetical protein
MATNRTPINRPPKSKITPEAVELFRRGTVLWPIYRECISEGGECRTRAVEHRHCRECLEFINTHKRLCWSILKLPPWHVSVLDPMLDDDEEVVGYMERGTCSAATVDAALELRRELQEAVRQEDSDAEWPVQIARRQVARSPKGK